MPDFAFLNGKILKIKDAFVSIEDRGYQFGDAIYEFIESFDFHILCLDEHLNRLAFSLRELDYPPISIHELKEQIITLFNKCEYSRAGCYLQVSRGVQPRSHSYTNQSPPQISMTIKDLSGIDPCVNETGIRIRTCEDYRWGMCQVKTVQLLPAALEQHKAHSQGLDDTVFISKKGIVREGTCTNIFIVKNGFLITHPLDNHILPGITRELIIETICSNNNIEVKEKYYTIDDLYSADEAFLCSTVLKIQPILEVDGKSIGNGGPGDLTRLIQAGYDKIVYQR